MRNPVVWPVQETEPDPNEQKKPNRSEAAWLSGLNWVLSLVVLALGVYALLGPH